MESVGDVHKIITFEVEYNVRCYKASMPRKARSDAPGALHLLKIAAINEISNLSIKLFQQCHLKPECRLTLEVCYERCQKFTQFRLSSSETS